ncbi:hypothetical protein FRB94_002945 [Tulasnella sp. JGI-2019a]|nr:hypothetical protein FRB93_013151 [Tulasnella sp. JGI-2019a]KAG9013417.1 hypothetical protein FRB94_002945 [Tulasnella sp. JGI-2019a]KAG9034744.1 hypothetical protein FRB95_012694 [Tulasnella sp. JGI-2019a]
MSPPNSINYIPPAESINSPTNNDSTDSVDHSFMYLNNYVQTQKLTWKKESNVIDEKRGLGWSATIFVDGTKYESSRYFKRKQEALNSAARNAVTALGVHPETGK